MDNSNRQRRHNDPPMHATSNNPRYQALQDSSSRRSFAGTASDRFRPAPLNTSPSAGSRSMAGATTYSTYYQEPAASAFSAAAIPQSTMGYHQASADYGGDGRQAQGYASTYNPTAMMYNVQAQAGAQNPASVYDTSQQFSARQPAAAMQMMATDVAAPYFPSEPTNAAATASALQSQPASTSATQAVYQQPSLQGYQSNIASMSGMAATQSSAGADTSMEEQDYAPSGDLEEAYASYQTALKEIFQSIRTGALSAASDSLLSVSDWLLGHVQELGLIVDSQSLYNDRIRLWNDFNHAWLGILQKQKDMAESRQQLQQSQSLITQDGLEKMGKELVRLCDAIERWGLVDYQYGVWEEQIIAILEECLDLYESSDDSGDAGGASTSQHR